VKNHFVALFSQKIVFEIFISVIVLFLLFFQHTGKMVGFGDFRDQMATSF